jgi:hypothetical protein
MKRYFRVPFQIGRIEGYLQVKDYNYPHQWFLVMVKGGTGFYSAGELIFKEGKWCLDKDSMMERYIEDLGTIAALWQDSHEDLHPSSYDIS